jgi:hypothetical protein
MNHEVHHLLLRRCLWQLLILGAIGAVMAKSAGLRFDFGPAAWLAALPLAALAAAYRHALAAAGRRLFAPPRRRGPTVTLVMDGAWKPRASVRLPSRGARDASDRHPVPGRRTARLQRRSPRHDTRSEPVAGRC